VVLTVRRSPTRRRPHRDPTPGRAWRRPRSGSRTGGAAATAPAPAATMPHRQTAATPPAPLHPAASEKRKLNNAPRYETIKLVMRSLCQYPKDALRAPSQCTTVWHGHPEVSAGMWAPDAHADSLLCSRCSDSYPSGGCNLAMCMNPQHMLYRCSSRCSKGHLTVDGAQGGVHQGGQGSKGTPLRLHPQLTRPQLVRHYGACSPRGVLFLNCMLQIHEQQLGTTVCERLSSLPRVSSMCSRAGLSEAAVDWQQNLHNNAPADLWRACRARPRASSAARTSSSPGCAAAAGAAAAAPVPRPPALSPLSPPPLSPLHAW